MRESERHGASERTGRRARFWRSRLAVSTALLVGDGPGGDARHGTTGASSGGASNAGACGRGPSTAAPATGPAAGVPLAGTATTHRVSRPGRIGFAGPVVAPVPVGPSAAPWLVTSRQARSHAPAANRAEKASSVRRRQTSDGTEDRAASADAVYVTAASRQLPRQRAAPGRATALDAAVGRGRAASWGGLTAGRKRGVSGGRKTEKGSRLPWQPRPPPPHARDSRSLIRRGRGLGTRPSRPLARVEPSPPPSVEPVPASATARTSTAMCRPG